MPFRAFKNNSNSPCLKVRKAELTETGETLLAEAEPLLAGFRALEGERHPWPPAGKTQI